MSDRDVNLYFADILMSMRNILKYTRNMDFADFRKDSRTVDAVIRNVEVMGEAASKIPAGTRKMHSDIPWSDMIAMRNKVIHGYFGVDLSILWTTIKEDLPDLKKKFLTICK